MKKSNIPKPLQDIIDAHSDVITLEPGAKHIKVKIEGRMVAVYSHTGSCKDQTLLNSVARLRRELRNRGLLRERSR